MTAIRQGLPVTVQAARIFDKYSRDHEGVLKLDGFDDPVQRRDGGWDPHSNNPLETSEGLIVRNWLFNGRGPARGGPVMQRTDNVGLLKTRWTDMRPFLYTVWKSSDARQPAIQQFEKDKGRQPTFEELWNGESVHTVTRDEIAGLLRRYTYGSEVLSRDDMAHLNHDFPEQHQSSQHELQCVEKAVALNRPAAEQLHGTGNGEGGIWTTRYVAAEKVPPGTHHETTSQFTAGLPVFPSTYASDPVDNNVWGDNLPTVGEAPSAAPQTQAEPSRRSGPGWASRTWYRLCTGTSYQG
ncbi:MAG TPA: hypothetical protein VGO93_02070 [Candidatus Xenobia bacterium]|jgi:hypothetical protein